MGVCDAHDAAWGCKKTLAEGEGFAIAARFMQDSPIQEKLVDKSLDVYKRLGMPLSRQNCKLQIESIQGATLWLICEQCANLLKLSSADKEAAREAARRWWKDKSAPGHMPGQKTTERNKKPAYFIIYGNGFTPSAIQAHLILRYWVEKVKGKLGEDIWEHIRMELTSKEHGSRMVFTEVFTEEKKVHRGQLVDGLFLLDYKTGQDMALIAVWAPEDSEYVGSLLKPNQAVKPMAIAEAEIEQIQKQVCEKPKNIYEILMDAICCVMCADGNATPKEQEAIHIILGKTKASWTKEDIDKRIDGFLERIKMDGMDKIVQATCENLPEFKSKKRREVLTFCLEFIARADGIVDEKEKQLIEKFKSALGVESGDSAPKSGSQSSKEERKTEEEEQTTVNSSPSDDINANKSSEPILPDGSVDDRIDGLWDSAKKLGWSETDCEKEISIYTEILGLVNKSSKYNACASLRNRAISYRNLKKFDEALNDLQHELEIAQKIGDRYRVMECQRVMKETKQMKQDAEIKASGGEKSLKVQSMEQQASKLSDSGAEGDAAFKSLFEDLANSDSDIRAKASQLLAHSSEASSKLINVYQESLVADPRKSVLAGRVLGRKLDGGRQDMIPEQVTMLLFRVKIAFTPCVCGRCGELNVGIPVPEKGLYIGFYGQTDDKHGAYALPVLCDYCGKEFFIAWDSDPRGQ